MTTFGTHFTRIVIIVAAMLACFGESNAQYRFRVAHLITGVPAIDGYIQGGTSPYLEDVPFESLSARSAPLNAATDVNITRANAGAGTPLLTTTIPVANGAYTLLGYGTTTAPKLATLLWPNGPQVNLQTAAVRVFNATTGAGSIDVYFDSTTSTPVFSALLADSVSAFAVLQAASSSLIITPAGSKTPIARFVLPLAGGTTQTLVVSGTGASDLAVRSFQDGSGPADPTPVTTLQREQLVGAAPTLRFVNALPQPDAKRLDVFLNGIRSASGVNYRSASGVLPGVGVGPVVVSLVPEGRTIVDAVYTTTMMLARDTAYTLVLTQFQSGELEGLELKRSFSEPAPGPGGHVKIRVANVMNFRSGVSLFSPGNDTAQWAIAIPAFLLSTDWRQVHAGPTTVQALESGATTPFMTGEYNFAPGGFYTLLAIGDATTFTIDILVHEDPGPQQPMATFGEPETSVRESFVIASRALQLKSTPNPIVDNARISFELARAGDVSLEAFDVMGQRVRVLASGYREIGTHAVELDGLQSGVYTVVLRSGGVTAAVGVVKY